MTDLAHADFSPAALEPTALWPDAIARACRIGAALPRAVLVPLVKVFVVVAAPVVGFYGGLAMGLTPIPKYSRRPLAPFAVAARYPRHTWRLSPFPVREIGASAGVKAGLPPGLPSAMKRTSPSFSGPGCPSIQEPECIGRQGARRPRQIPSPGVAEEGVQAKVSRLEHPSRFATHGFTPRDVHLR